MNFSQAASGIGKEIAFSLAEAGAVAVAFADLNLPGAQQAVEESKRWAINPDYRAIAVQVDVASPESVQSMVDSTVREFGRIDHSVNSAGVRLPSMHPSLEVLILDCRSPLNPESRLLSFHSRNMTCSTLSTPGGSCSATRRC